MSIQQDTQWGAISIAPESHVSALAALRGFGPLVEEIRDHGPKGLLDELKRPTLAEVLVHLGWGVDENADTNRYLEITSAPECYHRRDPLVLLALAPFVVEGGELVVWIQGDFYRWRFEGGDVYEDVGEVDFQDSSQPMTVADAIR